MQCCRHTPPLQRGFILSARISPDQSNTIISFADDTDGQVSKATTAPDPIPTVVKELTADSAQIWSNLVNIYGALIALHKCNWQLIAWELVSGHLRMMVQTTSESLIMEDGKGAYAVIDFLPPDHPNAGLGFRICPGQPQSPICCDPGGDGETMLVSGGGSSIRARNASTPPPMTPT